MVGKGGVEQQSIPNEPTYLNGELRHHRFNESRPLCRSGLVGDSPRAEPALGVPLSHRVAPLVLAELNVCHRRPNEFLDQYQRIRCRQRLFLPRRSTRGRRRLEAWLGGVGFDRHRARPDRGRWSLRGRGLRRHLRVGSVFTRSPPSLPHWLGRQQTLDLWTTDKQTYKQVARRRGLDRRTPSSECHFIKIIPDESP